MQYRMRSEEARAVKRAFLGEEQKDYFDSRYGFLDMHSLGIESVEMRAD